MAIKLYIPGRKDLWFREKMLSDPDTMSYNAPWFPPNGCIGFPESSWDMWYEEWIGKEPERFYAYLCHTDDDTFIGEVDFYHNEENSWWDMGIVLYAPYRGKGYAEQGLNLLLYRAFALDKIDCLHNDFESSREAAYHLHLKAGFKDIGEKDGIRQLMLTKEEYMNIRSDGE